MKTNLILVIVLIFLSSSCKNTTDKRKELSFDDKVNDYIQKFPYQDTYNYMVAYTGGDPSKLNKPTEGQPELTKAGEDKIVRMNNDTYYTGGFVYLINGPVKLSASYSDPTRFYSFQLVDDKNCNFQNIINPEGDYYLYYDEKPKGVKEEQLIKSPSLIAGVITRVEVKDKDNAQDVETAKQVFNGVSISGPEIKKFPKLDLLSGFEDSVANRANQLMDSVFANVPFKALVASPEQVPNEVSYLNLAAGTKGGWGGPLASHSSYHMMFFDNLGNKLDGNKGTYTITTEEPNVDAFWSVTAYDTERGGFFHPNKNDLYHINNTTAIRNSDGTITFTFKSNCEVGDLNCLEVPSGKFDLAVRYYLPQEDLISGKWTMPLPVLKNK
ncbi:DUF1214 domain-containing protein [uncultured Algibacter sp.]|uniref:DUF1214 domain-containing protein n=1 Tax=uncultured Algibacter sp. TaxID=298659 RepID=UPI00263170BF|nr:DUF1214 domain-containing protein [uncultured Algibacter sp.]